MGMLNLFHEHDDDVDGGYIHKFVCNRCGNSINDERKMVSKGILHYCDNMCYTARDW